MSVMTKVSYPKFDIGCQILFKTTGSWNGSIFLVEKYDESNQKHLIKCLIGYAIGHREWVKLVNAAADDWTLVNEWDN
jgi:hypothetical protein